MKIKKISIDVISIIYLLLLLVGVNIEYILIFYFAIKMINLELN
jgi:hypothetical protein